MEARIKFTLVGLAAAAVAACASPQPKSRAIAELSGMDMYQQLCASCHGVDARGEGPVAPLIKVGVPDLTRIAYRNGGEFPAEDVARTIDGRFERRGHGPRDMPVWGWQFYDASSADQPGERAQVDSMIARLVDYLRSVQRE